MLIKWITCEVDEQQKSRFAAAQQRWSAIAGTPGFLGQFGGWDLKNSLLACVCGLWRDEQSYRHFMAEVHDGIIEANDQSATIRSSHVALCQSEQPLPGVHADLASALVGGRLMRVADCLVRPHRLAHFREQQQAVWIPAMSTADGMLGGSFNRATDNPNRFIVTSLWRDAESHSAYANSRVPELRKVAAVGDDTLCITGHLVCLELSWLVLPEPA